jgi:hypothetical protein
VIRILFTFNGYLSFREERQANNSPVRRKRMSPTRKVTPLSAAISRMTATGTA